MRHSCEFLRASLPGCGHVQVTISLERLCVYYGSKEHLYSAAALTRNSHSLCDLFCSLIFGPKRGPPGSVFYSCPLQDYSSRSHIPPAMVWWLTRTRMSTKAHSRGYQCLGAGIVLGTLGHTVYLSTYYLVSVLTLTSGVFTYSFYGISTAGQSNHTFYIMAWDPQQC